MTNYSEAISPGWVRDLEENHGIQFTEVLLKAYIESAFNLKGAAYSLGVGVSALRTAMQFYDLDAMKLRTLARERVLQTY